MFGSIINLFFFTPLLYIYRHGPTPLFYGGLETEDICASLTSVPRYHWEKLGQEECNDIIMKKFNGFSTLILGIMYVLTLYHIFFCITSALWSYLTITRPLIRTIEDMTSKSLGNIVVE